MRREQSQGMTRIQDQSLLVGHRCQVFHSKQVLRPILEGSSISSIHYQFAGMLRHRIILSFEAEAAGIDQDRVVQRILDVVAVA